MITLKNKRSKMRIRNATWIQSGVEDELKSTIWSTATQKKEKEQKFHNLAQYIKTKEFSDFLGL